MVSKTDCSLETVFNGYRLRFGSHFGVKKLQHSMRKLIENMDAIWDAILFFSVNPFCFCARFFNLKHNLSEQSLFLLSPDDVSL